MLSSELWLRSDDTIEQLLTVQEFSQALKVKEATVRKLLLLRKIRSFKLGRKLVRIPVSELERLLSEIPARQVRDDS